MKEAMIQLCALSILCGAAMSIMPEGAVKRVTAIVCSVVLISAAAGPLMELDLSVYGVELARYRQREAELSKKGEALNEELNRLVIQERCGAYILDKANELGLELELEQMELRWDTGGFWVPHSARMKWTGTELSREKLASAIEAELGIPADRQYWSEYEPSEG